MRLPIEWIREYAPVDASTEEIASRLTMAGLEVEETASSISGDVLEIKVTPNRGDCLSVIGVARELAAAFGIPLKTSPSQLSIDSAELLRPVPVSVENPEGCPRYSARIIRNVKAVSSPAWMQERLTLAGMRPIGGIVDVTNYVMLEMGQPLHAFDLELLRGPAIVVRFARGGDKLTTLDGVDRELMDGVLLICDARGPVALAGVMGGADTEIRGSTRSVLLESAHFDPSSVRYTSRSLGLRTEASYRFERFVDPAGVVAASDRACALISDLGMGEPEDGVVDEYVRRYEQRAVGARKDRVSRLLGFSVTEREIEDSLNSLGFETAGRSGQIVAKVPSWRVDITREEDLVEEVGRVVGYERIPEKLPTGASVQGGDSARGRFAETARSSLLGAGLQEIISHSLLAPSPFEDGRTDSSRVAIRSALSAELSGLRRSLLPGLMEAMERNARRGLAPLCFFEIGNVFSAEETGVIEASRIGWALSGPLAAPSWQSRKQTGSADYYVGRGLVERLGSALKLEGLHFGLTEDPRLHPGRSAEITIADRSVGYVGELQPSLISGLTVRGRVVAAEIDLEALWDAAKKPAGFRPLSPFPSVTRDLAPRVSSDIAYEKVLSAVRSVESTILETLVLTDLFVGPPVPEGLKSLTLSFTFRSLEGTLTDDQVNTALDRIRTALESLCGATFVA